MAASAGGHSPPHESAGSRDRSSSAKRKARRDVYDRSSSEGDDESEQAAAAAASALADSPPNRSHWQSHAVPGTRSAFCMDRRLLVQSVYERRAASAAPRISALSSGAMRHQLRLPSAAKSARRAVSASHHRPLPDSASGVADGPMLQTSMATARQAADTPSTRDARQPTVLRTRLRLAASSSSQHVAGSNESGPSQVTAEAAGTGSRCRRASALRPRAPAQRMLTRSATATATATAKVHELCQLVAINEQYAEEGAKTSPKPPDAHEATTKNESDDKLRFPAWLFKDPEELVEHMHRMPTGARIGDEFVSTYGYIEDECAVAVDSKSDAAADYQPAGPSQ